MRPRLWATIVLAAFAAYLGFVFQLGTRRFWNSGLGDWMDPYFLNYLLEHWYVCAFTLSDPSSPPMFHPAERTLGYSHSLILYAPIYLVFRAALHPFQAYTLTLFLVMLSGSVCLYAFLRKILRLRWIEALALSAFFMTSPNVTNGWIGVWGQRASVFLIPPILLAAAGAAEMPAGARRTALATSAALLAALMLTHDFYTAILAVLVTALFVPALAGSEVMRVLRTHRSVLAREPLLPIAALAAAWSLWVWTSGGTSGEIFGLTVSSRNWRRPAIVAVGAMAVLTYRNRTWLEGRVRQMRPEHAAAMVGAFAGLVTFFSIHVAAFREHRGFSYSDVSSFLVPGGTSPYESLRTFMVVGALLVAAWVPWFDIEHGTRRRIGWIAIASLVVLLIPVRLGTFSVWTLFFELPGMSAIRDPKRVIYLYELAVVLAFGGLIGRLPLQARFRSAALAFVALVTVAAPNATTLDYARPNDVYARWVGAGVNIPGSCRSFFIKPASPAYTSRPGAAWTTYHLDAMFVALRHSIPTLNGYSAWAPEGWAIGDPGSVGYMQAVDRWIDSHRLTAVCALDIERRTMTPYPPG